ncbi:hypothetical protein [Rubinisphaera italica]|uniref:Uncharacterized protein n=1 Tax=Rubinisphaera italica TaxID=2527969 RepID=A0A5C5XNM3_9PLAN|nr:hypothetical protein [Rubinisphaera italica]TWT63973.1 hypothetical protein Pan54_47330 [Rubinisphaera italica]
MQITITLSDAEASQLQSMANAMKLDLEETLRVYLRSLYSASHDLPFKPASEMSYEEALAIVRHAESGIDGTFFRLRMGNDPGLAETLRLRMALRVLFHHLREKDSIPLPVCEAAASILFHEREARINLQSNSSNIRPELLSSELFDIQLHAFQLLSGASYDADRVRPDLGDHMDNSA